MQSKWFNLKPKAIQLRNNGKSIRNIEKKLGIPRSTLSGWLKNIKLSHKQIYLLTKNRSKNLNEARKLAVLWHNQQKLIRLKEAEKKALETLQKIDLSNLCINELALAMLYLGEGSKNSSGLGLGNSDPAIVKFFIGNLIHVYNIDPRKVKCSLHLRADQNPNKMKKFWSKALGLPLKNFMSVSIDLRTKGRPTYSNYNGVCVVTCGNIATQRKLLFLARKFCEKTANKWAVSSVGRASA